MHTKLDDAEAAFNPEPRSACVLLLDTSYSMAREPITQLNQGIQAFQLDLNQDEQARERVEVAIVTFGGSVAVRQDFVSVDHFAPPTLTAEGGTPMGGGINQAVQMLNDRKQHYRQARLNYFRPWIFLLTDGAPTDDWEPAADLVSSEEERGGLVLFAVGVGSAANFDILGRISRHRPPARLDSTKFREMFLWLSRSQSKISASQPDADITLPSQEPWTEKIAT